MAQAFDSTYAFSHLAGPPGGSGNADGKGAAARFSNPNGLAVDAAGNVYVSDSGSSGIRKITPAGVVTTLPRIADSYWSTAGVAVDKLGNVYLSNPGNWTIGKITPSGVATALLKTGQNIGFLYHPGGLALDNAGNLFVADADENSIVKMTAEGKEARTFAGRAQPGSADGTISAQFRNPVAVAVDAAGMVYVVDQGNHTIRKISPSGVVATLAGTAGQAGSMDGTGAAQFNSPGGVAVDLAGNVYVADTGNGTIRKITVSGVVTTFAGTAGALGSVDGTGSAARFYGPRAIAVDGAGNVYVGDGDPLELPGNYGGTIRKITPDGAVTTIAGLAGDHGSTDGNVSNARFNGPLGVAADSAGNVFVADTANSTIRKITPDGVVSTFAGAAGQTGSADGAGEFARFNQPTGVAVDPAGNIYVADHDNNTIRKITRDGVVTTLAGTAGSFGYADGAGATATFHHPVGLTVDAAGNLYVSDGDYLPGGDPQLGWGTIRKVTPDGIVSTLAGNPIVHDYYDHTPYSGGWFAHPRGLAVDDNGTVYVADQEGGILKVAPDGTVSLVMAVDGTGNSVWLDGSTGIVVDQGGNLIVTNRFSSTLMKITPTGVVTTLAGKPVSVGAFGWGAAVVRGGADGIGAAVQFNGPSGLAMDGNGNLYVADTGNNAIRRGQLASRPVIIVHPQSQTVTAGGSVRISVVAAAVPAPAYQWHKDGLLFDGATEAALSFTNARSADAGDYTVVVSNELGRVTSNKATLTVLAAPAPPPVAPVARSGGGGGATSEWFVPALLLLLILRRRLSGNTGIRHQRPGA